MFKVVYSVKHNGNNSPYEVEKETTFKDFERAVVEGINIVQNNSEDESYDIIKDSLTNFGYYLWRDGDKQVIIEES
jgi:hypothetical protein